MVTVKSHTRKTRKGQTMVKAHSRAVASINNKPKREIALNVHPLFGTETPSSKVLFEFETEFDGKLSDISSNTENMWDVETTDGRTFLIFKDEETAENFARDRVMEDLEHEPELFQQDWLARQIDEEKATYFFTEAFDEMNRSYVEDIESEDSNTFANRLAEEMVERGIISEADAKKGNISDENRDTFVEQMTNDQLSEGQGGFSHFESNFGDVAWRIAIENNLIDIEQATENALAEDGWQHFVSSYDGNSIDLPSGMVVVRRS